ncbi:MAG: pectate lyase [Oscillospiraceae bacterium]|nr:pectate lyase [Oscillospiraceae bacterium]
MKIQRRKTAAALLSAVLTVSLANAVLPAERGKAPVVLTASAAADDYPWSTYLKKSSDWFGSSEAIGVADDCIRYQIQNEGGWRKGMATEQTGDWAHSTVDNDATTSQIRILMRVYAKTGQQKYFDCAMRGVECLFKLQYSNGGYMQVLNTPGTYHAHITLNDGAYVHILEIMKEMSTKTGDFTAVSDSYAQRAKQSLEAAIDCLLKMQITVNGVKTAWCQQHDENTLAPAKARAYELPSVCTSESAGVVTFLYKYAQETGRGDIAAAVNAAIAWFKQVALYNIEWVSQGDDKVVVQKQGAGPIWARFYDIDRQIPLFSDRDSSVHYNVAEISQERRTGYAWYGNWGKNVIGLSPLPENGQGGTQTTELQKQEPEYAGEFVKKLVVHDITNGENWSVQENLKVGARIFGDRDFTYAIVPNELAGAEYIRPACNSKTYTGDLAELTAAAPLTVYVMVDTRLSVEQGIKPRWLSGWTNTGMIAASSNTETFEIFARELDADETLTLGSNMTGSGVVNYTVAVVPREVIPDTTTTTTTTTTATTTTTTETTTSETLMPSLRGDVDCNGLVQIADAIMLARYLAEDQIIVTVQGLNNAETTGDNALTAEDSARLLQYLAGVIDGFGF